MWRSFIRMSRPKEYVVTVQIADGEFPEPALQDIAQWHAVAEESDENADPNLAPFTTHVAALPLPNKEGYSLHLFHIREAGTIIERYINAVRALRPVYIRGSVHTDGDYWAPGDGRFHKVVGIEPLDHKEESDDA